MPRKNPILCKGRSMSRCKGASKSCKYISRKITGVCGYCKRYIAKKTNKADNTNKPNKTKKNKKTSELFML